MKSEVRLARQQRRLEKARKRLEKEQPTYQKNQPTDLRKPLKFLTAAQRDYAQAIKYGTYIFGIGPAGTGKTYVATTLAAQHFLDGGDIILTRPAVEAAGEELGFLPGDLAEKFGPYMKPVMRILIDQLGEGAVECAVKNGRIQSIPMAFMRGETFANAFILADEMQNATPAQFKMLLTRIGEDSRMVIDGDPAQTDIGEDSGLMDAVGRLKGLEGVEVVRFDKDDIVRHDIIQAVIERYER